MNKSQGSGLQQSVVSCPVIIVINREQLLARCKVPVCPSFFRPVVCTLLLFCWLSSRNFSCTLLLLLMFIRYLLTPPGNSSSFFSISFTSFLLLCFLPCIYPSSVNGTLTRPFFMSRLRELTPCNVLCCPPIHSPRECRRQQRQWRRLHDDNARGQGHHWPNCDRVVDHCLAHYCPGEYTGDNEWASEVAGTALLIPGRHK